MTILSTLSKVDSTANEGSLRKGGFLPAGFCPKHNSLKKEKQMKGFFFREQKQELHFCSRIVFSLLFFFFLGFLFLGTDSKGKREKEKEKKMEGIECERSPADFLTSLLLFFRATGETAATVGSESE